MPGQGSAKDAVARALAAAKAATEREEEEEEEVENEGVSSGGNIAQAPSSRTPRQEPRERREKAKQQHGLACVGQRT